MTNKTTPVPLKDVEIIHLRATIEESRETVGGLSPAFDAMVDGLIEKLGAAVKPFPWKRCRTRRPMATKSLSIASENSNETL